jgi:adenylylsulfate kinase-like enzyme
MVYLITGKKDAGKTHYGTALTNELLGVGFNAAMLDGDVFRDQTKNQDFTDEGRRRNLIGAAQEAARMEREGAIVVCCFIAPKKEWRDAMREYWKESKVIYIPGGTLWPGTTYEVPSLLEQNLK